MDIDDPGLAAMLLILTACSVAWAMLRDWQYRHLHRSHEVAMRLLRSTGLLRNERTTHGAGAVTVSGETYARMLSPEQRRPHPRAVRRPPTGSNRARVYGPVHPPRGPWNSR